MAEGDAWLTAAQIEASLDPLLPENDPDGIFGVGLVADCVSRAGVLAMPADVPLGLNLLGSPGASRRRAEDDSRGNPGAWSSPRRPCDSFARTSARTPRCPPPCFARRTGPRTTTARASAGSASADSSEGCPRTPREGRSNGDARTSPRKRSPRTSPPSASRRRRRREGRTPPRRTRPTAIVSPTRRGRRRRRRTARPRAPPCSSPRNLQLCRRGAAR